MKALGKIIVGVSVTLASVAIVVGVYAAAYYGGIVGNHVQANYQKRVVTDQVQQVVRTAGFAQAAYESFFNDCNAILADNLKITQARTRIAVLRQAPTDSFGQSSQRVADAVTDLTGLQQIQVDTAARYNADAAEYTRGQFLAASLPSHIDPPYNITCE